MTYAFKLLIGLDRLFNILTGGDIGVCFSTRCYINSQHSKLWTFARKFVDRLMFEENHCYKSYKWEYKVKKDWLRDNYIERDEEEV